MARCGFSFFVVASDLVGGEIERETCKEKEREMGSGERERVSRIKVFGFRSKYGMY